MLSQQTMPTLVSRDKEAEAKQILYKIATALTPKVNESDYPLIRFNESKSVDYVRLTNTIYIGINNWKNMNLAQKRMAIIREYVRAVKKRISANEIKMPNNIMEILIYLNIYGYDKYYQQWKTESNENFHEIKRLLGNKE